MKRFCSQCGSTVEADARFCDNCGADVQSEQNVAPAAQRPAEPARSASPPSRRFGMVGLLIAAALLLAAIGGGFYWFSGDSGPSSKQIQAAFDDWAAEKSRRNSSLTNAQYFACSRRAGSSLRPDGSDIVWYAAVSKQYSDAPHGVVLIDPRWSKLANALIATGVAEAPAGRIRSSELALSGERVVIAARLTEAGSKLARAGLLCFGDSVAIGEIEQPPTVIDFEGKRAARVMFSLKLVNPHPWIEHPDAKAFADAVRLARSGSIWEKTSAGWVRVTDDARASKLNAAIASSIASSDKGNTTNKATPEASSSQSRSQAAAPSSTQGIWQRISNWFGGLFGGSSVVGKWADADGEIEFFDDGKLTVKMNSGKMKGELIPGTWTELEGGRIRVDLQILGFPVPPMFVTRQGDQLHVSSNDGKSGTLAKVK